MKATLIEDKLTPLTAREVCRAFQSAFFGVTLQLPTKETLALLMAQSALESGRWKSLHCFNFTNIKAADTYEGLYCLYRCNEIINGKVEWFDPPHAQCRFRAFKTIEDGATDYLTFLATRKRYADSWAQALRGDPSAFVSALKRAGFFTASEEPYRRAVASLMREYLTQIPAWLAPLEGSPPAEDNPPLEQPGTIAEAFEASIDAMHDNIRNLRRDSMRDEGLLEPKDDEITKTDPPRGNS